MRTIKAKMLGPPTTRNDGGGLDHDIKVDFLDAEDNDVNRAHAVFPIPVDEFAELLEPTLTKSARITLYKAKIMQFYGAGVGSLEIPTRPVGLNNLSAWDAYGDAMDAYDAELASRTAQAMTLAAQATSWIEGLEGFEGWPFAFVLQQGN